MPSTVAWLRRLLLWPGLFALLTVVPMVVATGTLPTGDLDGRLFAFPLAVVLGIPLRWLIEPGKPAVRLLVVVQALGVAAGLVLSMGSFPSGWNVVAVWLILPVAEIVLAFLPSTTRYLHSDDPRAPGMMDGGLKLRLGTGWTSNPAVVIGRLGAGWVILGGPSYALATGAFGLPKSYPVQMGFYVAGAAIAGFWGVWKKDVLVIDESGVSRRGGSQTFSLPWDRLTSVTVERTGPFGMLGPTSVLVLAVRDAADLATAELPPSDDLTYRLDLGRVSGWAPRIEQAVQRFGPQTYPGAVTR